MRSVAELHIVPPDAYDEPTTGALLGK